MKIKKKTLPQKYDDAVPLGQQPKNAQKEYEDGNYIEAFVMLYSLLEFQLNSIWSVFTVPHRISGSEIKEKEYGILTDILSELGVINDDLRSNLLEFKKGRNEAVHHLMKSEKITKQKSLDSQFKKGLKSYDVLFRVLVELMMKTYTMRLGDSSKAFDKLMKDMDYVQNMSEEQKRNFKNTAKPNFRSRK